MRLELVNGTVNDFHIVLTNRNFVRYGEISTIDKKSLTINLNLNTADEISFTAYKTFNGKKCEVWDQLTDLRLVYVVELGEYFQIEVQLDDQANKIYKTVSGISLCEAELSQTNIVETYINTEEDIARDDYVVTKFYNPDNPNGSLLHRILKKAPHYSIGHVDNSLKNLQRSFALDDISIYDFLVGECAEQFNSIFQFDSATRTINAYDLYTVCNDCGYRGEFNDKCPECNSTNLSYFGEDTTISISKENLTDDIQYTTDVDSIKNCFKLEAGDDVMTAAIVANNPNGSNYIYYLSAEQKADMSDELVEKLEAYDKLYDSKKDIYLGIMETIYDCIDQILYYTSGMMPDIEHTDVTATTEAAKLTNSNLSPVGLTSVTTSTSVATVNAAVRNYANVFVKHGYVKLEVENGTFDYEGTDSDGNHYGYWKGRIKVTNYADEEDIAYSPNLNIKVYDLYEDFLKQKIEKALASEDDEDGSIFDVLEIDDLDNFKNALTYYSLNRLQSFYDAITGCLDIMIEADQASEMADLYNLLYVPYKNKLDACQAEMDKRQATIDEWQEKYDIYTEQKEAIQDQLNFEEFLGDKLFLEFSAYRREDVYSNDNFISDGLDNAELFENAQEFLSSAQKEIVKSGEAQHSISSSLHNLLLIKEFEPIKDHFQLGAWIRFRVDDKLYRLRLIKIPISFDDIGTISCEFSDLTRTPDVVSDTESILKSAQSMATSYSSVSKQASKGNEAQTTFEQLQQEGFNSALYAIKNADTEEIIFNKNGLLARSYDDITDTYSDEQFKLTHNVMAFTDDNWKSVRTALGKQRYTLNGITYDEYGLNANFVIAGKMIAGDIYSANYKADLYGTVTAGTHIDLNNGNFAFAGGKLKYNSTSDQLNMSGTLTASTIIGGDISGSNITGTTITGSSIKGGTITGNTITGGAINGTTITGGTISGTNVYGSTISGGSITIGNNFKVENNGMMTASNAVLSGSFTQYASSGYKSVEIYDNKIDFYSWNVDGNYVGSIAATKQDWNSRIGIALYCDMGDMLTIGYKRWPSDPAYNEEYPIAPAIQIDSNNTSDTPWIMNTASGTIFPDNPSGGINVQNGLIKNWNLSASSGTVSLISGLSWNNGNITSVTRTDIEIKNGLIISWSSSTTNY